MQIRLKAEQVIAGPDVTASADGTHDLPRAAALALVDAGLAVLAAPESPQDPAEIAVETAVAVPADVETAARKFRRK